MRVRDAVFVVTGGGNGVGREVVLALLHAGARVAAVDIGEAALAETAAQAPPSLPGERRARLSSHVADVTDRDAVAALPASVVEAFGQVDGLVNVAGVVQPFSPLAELSFEAIERVMGVNFWGTVNTSKAFLPVLTARPAAALVNVSSMGALVPVPGQGAYGASKAAVKLFTEGLLAEHRDTSLSVGVVIPGGIATNILSNSGVRAPASDAAIARSSHLTSPREAARRVVRALETGQPRTVIGRDAAALDLLSRVAPTRTIDLVARKMADLVARAA